VAKRNYIRDTNHPDYPHNTLSGYQKGCRCYGCRRAKADYNLSQKGVKSPAFRKLLDMPLDHPDFPHGTRTGYKYCKCEKCRAANTEYKVRVNTLRLQRDELARKNKTLCDSKYRQTKEGRAIRRAAHAKRRALKKETAPTSHVDLELIKVIYLHRPDGFHVDHIIPLDKGGDHKPDNLQYLPETINLKKGPKLSFDCSGHSLRWQDLIEEPSTTIPQGSRVKRPEVLGNLIT
jgi:hypothetical protein